MSDIQEANNQVVNNDLAEKLEEKRDVIKNTVAKNADDNELDMFLHLAKQYGLDPFQGEIYFWKFGSKDPTIMTSRDGYLKIANQNPAFDGMDSGVIYPGDDFKKTQDGVEHKLDISNMSKTPVGAYAVVYRTDREVPIRVIVPFEDYKQDKKVWRQYPSAMIQKCAESMALKRAFSVSGLVSKEEMGYNQDSNNNHLKQSSGSNQSEVEEPEALQEDKQQVNESRQDVINEIAEIINRNDKLDGTTVKDTAEDNFDTREMQDLNLSQLELLRDMFEGYREDDDIIDISDDEIEEVDPDEALSEEDKQKIDESVEEAV